MASDLIPYKDWLKRTSLIGRVRSKELKVLDEALKHYEEFGGGDARWRVEQALNAWKAKEGPGDAWKKAPRNKKNHSFEHLSSMLGGKGDSEAGWGRAPDFMHESFNHSRLGVIYLLGKLDARADIFSVVLEGGIGIAGSVMSWQGGKIDDGGLGKVATDTAQNFFNTAIIPGSMVMSSMNEAAIDMSGEKRDLSMRAKALFQRFIEKTVDSIKQKLACPDFTIAACKNLVNLCCKLFTATVTAGLVSGAIDTFKGLVNFADASADRFKAYLRGRGVVVMSGHPATIVQSIKTAMDLGMLEGVWQTLKGAGNIGLAFATWGAAMIVGVITAIFEMIVKLVWRLVELFKMRKIFREAADHWANRESPKALHKKPFEFHQWYRDRALLLPPISILTLNSGICGDKMTFLNMFKGPNEQISAEEFQKGSGYLDYLRVWGVSYLGKAGYSFFGKDAFVNGLLTHAKSHSAPKSIGQKAWGMVKTVANA